MIALVRYVAHDARRSLRWVAPVLLFFGTQAVLDANTGSVLPTYAGSAAVLFFVAAWITVAVSNAEDAVQTAITTTAAGSRIRLRLAKLATSYLFCLPLVVLALVVPPFVSHGSRLTWSQLGTGAAAQSITVLAGGALGALCSRPIVKRTAIALLLGVGLSLGDSIFPSVPPVGQLMNLLSKAKPHDLVLWMCAIAAETVVLSGLAVAASLRLARLRS